MSLDSLALLVHIVPILIIMKIKYCVLISLAHHRDCNLQHRIKLLYFLQRQSLSYDKPQQYKN